ncbi:retinitis pigmentosa 1-like 1 protein isoform X2 [Notolabrus celidotus]|uniref:retinitis pigmentosa 1-like 1 protein isoform X2 n=1 Tax=Notolabrus celidotus TaxID=1203425 RepID=UPI00148F6D18|nr:retinitis pigmentosa 1-like 1 protein isoform X2 [Notolabrus celidotus]
MNRSTYHHSSRNPLVSSVSANQAKSEEVIPGESAVETKDDTKPQAATEPLVQNGEPQPEISVTDIKTEIKDANAEAAVEQINGEHIEAAAVVAAEVLVEESIPDGEAQTVASAEDPAVQQIVDTVAEIKEALADQTADEAKISADVHVEDPVSETPAVEEVKDTAEVPVASPANSTPQGERSTEPKTVDTMNVEAAAVEPTDQSAEESSPAEHAAEEIIKAVTEVAVEPSSDKGDVTDAKPGEEAAVQESVETVAELSAESASESPTQVAAEAATEVSSEKGTEEAAKETVEAVAEVAVESVHEIPVVTETAEEKVAPQGHVDPVPDIVADTVSVSPAPAAPETEVKSVECEVQSAASVEPVSETTVEEVVESVVQPVVEQSVELAPESAAEPVVDAVEPVTAPDAEVTQDKTTYKLIELTDALDEEIPTAETVPEPLPDLKETDTEETKLIQESEETKIPEVIQKLVEEPRYILKETSTGIPFCSFCDTLIDGNVKITFSEPLVRCHPDCLKCGVCAKALGDLLTPMFLHNQVIQCDGCFAKAIKT